MYIVARRDLGTGGDIQGQVSLCVTAVFYYFMFCNMYRIEHHLLVTGDDGLLSACIAQIETPVLQVVEEGSFIHGGRLGLVVHRLNKILELYAFAKGSCQCLVRRQARSLSYKCSVDRENRCTLSDPSQTWQILLSCHILIGWTFDENRLSRSADNLTKH